MSGKGGMPVILVIALIAVSAVLLLPVTVAQQATVAIDDGSAAPTEEDIVSIMINDVPVDIMTADVTLTYNSSVVHVMSVSNGQFDNLGSTINNGTGSTRIIAYQGASAPLTGNVKLCDVTLKAVGSAGASSPLTITVTRLEAGDESVITATADNGTFTISEEEENIPPIVTNASADPLVIPEDTDNEPLWGELAELMVNATDESGIANITIAVNLSSVGKEVVWMAMIGNFTVGETEWGIFNCTTNASVGTAGWNETSGTYEPYCLQVNATDIYGNSNTSVCINLTVMKNGDVSGNGVVTLYDASYISKWYLGKEGFETIIEGVADVSGNGAVTLYDASYISKWYLGKEGFETLK